jgi:type I restriction enzyme, S subunit
MIGLVSSDIGEAYINQHIALARPSHRVDPVYVAQILTAPFSLGHLQRAQRGIKNSLGLNDIRELLIPIPPLAEQKRIVAKVGQLMTLCDELEVRQRKKKEAGIRLTRAALDALASANGPEEFAKAWQRVSDNFEVLLATPESIGKVRKTILELAIRGRLVRQDPAEGPASEVLQLVSERRLKLQPEKKVGHFEPVPPVPAQSTPYVLPSSWLWTRLDNVSICRDGQRIPLSKQERQQRQGSYDYYGASGVIDSIDDFIFEEPLLLVGEDGANLINRSTPIAFIAMGRYWVNNHAHILDGANLDSLRYLAVFINAIDLVPYVTGTAQPKMNQAKMNSIPVAVPPLAEQKRIVAKVDQLMALCDALESKLRDAERGAQRLAEAMAAEMVA